MQFELVRDPSGDPRAIRVRWTPPDLSAAVRRVRACWPERCRSMVSGIARGLRSLVSSTPRFRVVRDGQNRAVGFAIRLDDVATATDLAAGGWLTRARQTASRAMTSIAAVLPRVGVERAEDGWPDAVRIRVGTTLDGEAVPYDERRTQDWVIEPAGTIGNISGWRE